MHRISVILTTYNSSSTIERAVLSVQRQIGINELFEVELLVVDDCSTDDTLSRLRALGIEALSTNENSGGPNRGRNLALGKATGDYITIMDHDDEWQPDRILRVIPYLNKAPIISGGYILEDESTGSQTPRYCRSEEVIRFAENQSFLQKLQRSGNMQNLYLGGLMFSRELGKIRFEEEFGMADFDWLLRLLHGRHSLEVCAPLFKRYVDGDNLSLNKNYRNNDYHVSLKAIRSYSSQYPEASARGELRLNGSLARYHYLIGEMKECRKYLKKADRTLVNALYYITSFWGHGFVRKNFRIFG